MHAMLLYKDYWKVECLQRDLAYVAHLKRDFDLPVLCLVLHYSERAVLLANYPPRQLHQLSGI